MKRITKAVALICSVALLMGLIPTAAFAANDQTSGSMDESVVSSVDVSATDEILTLDNLTEEDIIGEVESLREENAKHFMLSDGTMVAVSYPHAVHEKVDDEWVEIDNTLSSVTDSDGDSVERTASQNVKFSFVNGKGNGRLVKVEDVTSKAQIIVELENANKKNLVLSEMEESDELFAVSNIVQKGTYTEILDDTDIEYIIAGTTLKENIIVKNADGMGAVSFVLRCKNVTAALQEDNSVVFSDADGNTVFTIPAPFMYDAAGQMSHAVAVSLESHKKGYLYTVTPDEEWAQDEARVYPITIDPALTVDAETTTSYEAVWEKTDNSFSFPMSFLPVGTYSGVEVGTLIYMDIPSSLTDSSCIIDASMQVYCVGTLGNVTGPTKINAYQFDGDWDFEQSIVASSEDPSIIGGALDYVLFSETVSEGYITLDITEAVHNWTTSDGNNGILLRAQNTNNCIVFGGQNMNDSMVPIATYHYRDTRGIEDYWTYTAVQGGLNGAIGVNNYTGNLVYVQPIIEADSETALDLTWTYSANASTLGWYGNMGIGSSTNYHITIGAESNSLLAQTYPYYMIDADGTKHSFIVKPTDASEETTESTVVEYVDEDNLGYTLTLGTSTYVAYRVTDANGRMMIFNSDGHLTRISDENGENVITVNTSISSMGYLLNSVSNEDQTISFTYERVNERNRVNYIQVGEDIYDLEYDDFYLTSITYPDGKKVQMSYSYISGTTKHLTKVSTNQDELNTEILYYGVTQNDNSLTFSRVCDLSFNNGETTALQYSFRYGLGFTDIDDGTGRIMTYQFNNYGHTTGIINQSTKQGQYYEFGVPGNLTAEELSQANQLLMVSNTMQSNNNLLQNPHMVSRSNNPWTLTTEKDNQSCQFQWSTDTGHSDSTSALFVQVATNPAEYWLRQSISNLTPGNYTASAYGTTNGVALSNSGATLKVEILNESNVVVRTAYSQAITATAENEWKQLFASFSLAEGETARVCVGTKDAVGGFWVDDLCLEEGEVASAYNLLLNSAFDSAATWDGTYSVSDQAACLTGSASSMASVSQTVAINQACSDNISFGAWAKAPSVATNPIESLSAHGKVGQPTFALELVFLDNTATEIENSSVMVSYNDGTDDWQYVCGGAEIPEDAAFAKLVLHYDYNLGTACFDDAFVYLSDYVAYKMNEDEVIEDETVEEPYDYTQETQWYSDITTTTTDENGNTIETQVSQTISGTVSTELVVANDYYVINASTGEALYAPTVAAGEQVYLRPLVAGDTGYIWTLEKPGQYQLSKSKDGSMFNLTLSSGGYAQLGTASTGVPNQVMITFQDDGSTVLSTGYSWGEKNLDLDFDAETDNEYLTAVTHTVVDTESETQKWLFVPCYNNTYIQTQTTYDADGNMLSQTDERGNTTTYTYDADGNVLSMTDPKGNVTTYTYDANGNVTAMQNGDSTVSYTYTKDMLTAIEKDNTASDDGGEVFYSFVSDAFDRPLNVTVGDGKNQQSLVSYAYNPRHSLSSLTYGNGATMSYTYDDVDLVTSIQYNGNEKFSFAYTDNNQMALIKDFADNRRTRLIYDDAGNISGVLVTDDAHSDGGNELLYKGYLSTDSANGFTVSVNDNADITQLVKTDEYDQAEGLLLNGEEVVTYSYDEFGRVIGRKVNTDSARNETLTYVAGSGTNSTTNLVNTYNNTQRTYQYSYDVNGNLSAVSEGIVVRVYQYDELGQLIEERDRYTNTTTQYTYDDGGNLVQKIVYPDFYGANGTPYREEYSYGEGAWADLLTEYGGIGITYDTIGNPLTWRNEFEFTWQNGRELASATNTSTSVTYTYNQNGIRTSKTVNGVKTTYVLDENDLLMGEITGENTIVYLYDENSSIYGFVYNGTPYFYLFNGQGDVMNIVDETGTVVATYNYDAWGKVITATGDMAAINPIRYRGYYYDAETELYYLQSRYYDAVVGRFLNADDVMYLRLYESSCALNLFGYCCNNSVNMYDPNGRWVLALGIEGQAAFVVGIYAGFALNIDGNWNVSFTYSIGFAIITNVAAYVQAYVAYYIGKNNVNQLKGWGISVGASFSAGAHVSGGGALDVGFNGGVGGNVYVGYGAGASVAPVPYFQTRIGYTGTLFSFNLKTLLKSWYNGKSKTYGVLGMYTTVTKYSTYVKVYVKSLKRTLYVYKSGTIKLRK